MPRRFTPALVFLIIANLVPLFGVFYFGWTVADILILYWLENLVVGALNIPKMWACTGNPIRKLFLSAFFAVHFGMFCWGHGMIITEIFSVHPDWRDGLMMGPFRWAIISLLISHSFSMMVNFFGRQEYAGRDVSTQMFLPYGRIAIMHVVVLIGGFLVDMLGSPIYALLLLIALKILIDMAAHRKEHRDKASPA